MIEKTKALITKLLRNEGFLYLLVGGSNTLISWTLTFILATVFHLGYWPTSVITFSIGVAYSYLLNRKYTFRAGDLPHSKTLPRFLLNVGVCYLIAMVSVKALLDYMFANVWSVSWPEEYVTLFKLLSANIVYIVLNYIGQKFFAFSKKGEAPPETAGDESEDVKEKQDG
ncbi:MAG: GtrA family protein [Oscillospiraceae bacterium]|nr:GtrA family protein [Oscillospiraceae bacterium]